MKQSTKLTNNNFSKAKLDMELPAYILWDVSDKNNWQLVATGTREECVKAAEEFTEDGDLSGLAIHANELKDTWENSVEGFWYDTYMDGSTDRRPI
jgi:hypothetical protein